MPDGFVFKETNDESCFLTAKGCDVCLTCGGFLCFCCYNLDGSIIERKELIFVQGLDGQHPPCEAGSQVAEQTQSPSAPQTLTEKHNHAHSCRNHKDAQRVVGRVVCLRLWRCPWRAAAAAVCLISCVCVCFARAAALGAVETLRNGWSSAGHRLPVAGDLAGRGSSAHHGGGTAGDAPHCSHRSIRHSATRKDNFYFGSAWIRQCKNKKHAFSDKK